MCRHAPPRFVAQCLGEFGRVGHHHSNNVPPFADAIRRRLRVQAWSQDDVPSVVGNCVAQAAQRQAWPMAAAGTRRITAGAIFTLAHQQFAHCVPQSPAVLAQALGWLQSGHRLGAMSGGMAASLRTAWPHVAGFHQLALPQCGGP